MSAGLPVLLAGGVDPKDASPGIGAFIAFLILALVIILLAWSFTRHQRRIRANAAREAEQAAAEREEAAGGPEAPETPAEGPEAPETPGAGTGTGRDETADEPADGASEAAPTGAASAGDAPNRDTPEDALPNPPAPEGSEDDGGARR